MMSDQYKVKTYSKDKAMQKDINRMANHGYIVDKQTTDSRIGCKQRLLGGFLFARPKVFHTVTYKLNDTN